MSELPRYWSPAFITDYKRRLEADPAFQKAARKLDTVVVLRCTGTPDGKDMASTYTLRHGKIDVDVFIDDSPSSEMRAAPFGKPMLARTTASYEVWTKLDKGEMSVLGAIASPDYHLEGGKFAVMRNIGMFNAMSAVSAKTPKVY